MLLNEYAKILLAVAKSGEIIGRKKLQKMIFIAKKLNFPFQEKFQFHFFGPYSEELTLKIEELCHMGFLQEVKEKKGGYYQYRYTLTESGHEFLKHQHVQMPSLDDCLQNMNEKSARFLELVSTILYFDNLPKEEVIEKLKTLKASQKYTMEEIDEGFEYIKSLHEQVKYE